MGDVSKELVTVLGVISLLGLAGCNDNNLTGMPGDISANPTTVDYGRVQEQTDFGQTVIVTNVGERAINVTGFRIEPPDAPFVLVTASPTVASPWVLGGSDWKPIDIHFQPLVAGDLNATLYVSSTDPDEAELAIPLLGRGYHVQADTYTNGQQLGGIADILFIVDNSGSMDEEQAKLGNSFGTFINWLVSSNVDYRIAITSTDMADPNHQGRFQGTPKILVPTTPNIINTFKTNATLGANGSGDEQGLIGGLLAVQPALATTVNSGFLRPEARLFVVWVTDEEDSSPNAVQNYLDGFAAVKGGDPSRVFYAAIAGPGPLGCFSIAGSADYGARYVQAVNQTGGLFGSICDPDFGVALQDLAFEVTSAQGSFPLTMVPIVESIVVLVDGVEQQAGWWTYASATNSVSFIAPHVPAGGSHVQITYEVF